MYSEHFLGEHLDRVLLGSDDITRVCSHLCCSWCLAPLHLNCCHWDEWAHTLAHGIALHWSWLRRIAGISLRSALGGTGARWFTMMPLFCPLPTPRAEWKTTMSSQGFREMYPFLAHDLWGFHGWHHPKIMNLLGRTYSCAIGCLELLLAWPWVMNWMYLSVQKTGHIHHFP